MTKRAGSKKPVILLVSGQAQDLPRVAMALPPGAVVTASVLCGPSGGWSALSAAASSSAASVAAAARAGEGAGATGPQPQQSIRKLVARPGRDVVLLTLAGGPTLILHPDHAQQLLEGAGALLPEPGPLTFFDPDAAMPPDFRSTPGGRSGLTSPPGTRLAFTSAHAAMVLRDLLVEVSIVTGLLKKATPGAVLAALVRRIDGAVSEGLYPLEASVAPARLADGGGRLAPAAIGPFAEAGPMLVLVHGTFVDTGGTFGALWRVHPALVRALFSHYQGRVLGFDHATLGRSPIANALMLARALPAGAQLHLLTHSRGGLVAEVLARACAGNALRPDETARFGAPDQAGELADLRALFGLAREKALSVTRVTRVACPARGTLLASDRLDLYLSLLGWGLQLAGLSLASQLVEFMHQVALRRTDPAQLPGIEAMMEGSATIGWLNDGTGVPGQLRVVAGQLEGDTLASMLKTLLAQAFYWSANDLVVQTAAMYGGAVRPDGEAAYFLASGAAVTHFSYFIEPQAATAAVDALTLAAPLQFQLLDAALRAGRAQGFAAPVQSASQSAVQSAAPASAPPDNGWLPIAILNADLRFSTLPLLAGHYSALRLTGAERALDSLLDGAMSAALRAGLYPEAPGSYQVFGLDAGRTVIVAGLGDEGVPGVAMLRYTARQAILGYARQLSERADAPAGFEIAATLAGSGGAHISAGAAALALTQGAADAAELLQADGWPRLTRLTLIELYLDRASDAWQALRASAWAGGNGEAGEGEGKGEGEGQGEGEGEGVGRSGDGAPARWRLDGRIGFGAGALRTPQDSSYRGADYDFISALLAGSAAAAPGQPQGGSMGTNGPHTLIAYTLDTRRARMEVHAQRAQGALVRELVSEASNHACVDPQIGRTLFQLLVPAEIEPYLAGAGDLVIELDATTAAIPWELLDAGPRDPARPPWAVRSKLVRKLRLERFRQQPRDAGSDDHVLVIGEPLCQRFPRLPGAHREALAVAAALARDLAGADIAPGLAGERLCLLANQDDAHTVINALYRQPWRIVHVAGHGVAGPDGGVALSGPNAVLGADEVAAMRVVPELVFLNCCHLGAFGPLSGGGDGGDAGADADAEAGAGTGGDAGPLVAQTWPARHDRAAFAANMAEALIRAGVRCVIAAGWAVEDHAAERFAAVFYDALLDGARFIDAVGAAREAAWRANPQGNTWAAYQCYGDPEWRWRRRADGAAIHHHRSDRRGAEADRIASAPALVLLLEALATEGANRAALAAGGHAPALSPAPSLPAIAPNQPLLPVSPVSPVSPDLSLRLEQLERAFGADWGDIGAVAEAFGAAWAGVSVCARAAAWYCRAVQASDGTASLRAAEQWAALLLDPANREPAVADLEQAATLLRALVSLHPHPARERLLARLLAQIEMNRALPTPAPSGKARRNRAPRAQPVRD